MAILTHCPNCRKIQVRPGTFARQAISCGHCGCVFTAYPESEADAVHEPDHVEVLEPAHDLETVHEVARVEVLDSAPSEAPLDLAPAPTVPPPDEAVLDLGPAFIIEAPVPLLDEVEVVAPISPVRVGADGELVLVPVAAPVDESAIPPPPRRDGPIDIRLRTRGPGLGWGAWVGLGLGVVGLALSCVVIAFIVRRAVTGP